MPKSRGTIEWQIGSADVTVRTMEADVKTAADAYVPRPRSGLGWSSRQPFLR
jgi:hypothetical protein